VRFKVFFRRRCMWQRSGQQEVDCSMLSGQQRQMAFIVRRCADLSLCCHAVSIQCIHLVCPSICLSRWHIVSKRLTCYQTFFIAWWLPLSQFYHRRPDSEIPIGSPPTGAPSLLTGALNRTAQHASTGRSRCYFKCRMTA